MQLTCQSGNAHIYKVLANCINKYQKQYYNTQKNISVANLSGIRKTVFGEPIFEGLVICHAEESGGRALVTARLLECPF